MGRKKIPKSELAPKLPKIGLLPAPSKTVLDRVRWGLVYDPPKELQFQWKTTGKNPCPDCILLSSLGFQSLDKFPTYPREGKTMCLSGNSVVFGNRGPSKLATFHDGCVETQDGLKKHAGLASYNSRQTFKIKTKLSFSLSATEEHPLLTCNNDKFEWKQINELNEGDWLVFRKGFLHEGDDNPVMKHFGELFGYMVGDGHINFETYKIGLFVEKAESKYHLRNYLRSLLQNFLPNRANLKPTVDGFRLSTSAQTSNLFTILASLNVTSSKFDLPTSNSTAFYRGYLRGLFSADGCIATSRGGKNTQVLLLSSYPEFLHQIQIILIGLGIIASIRKRTDPFLQTFPSGAKYWARPSFSLKILGGENLNRFARLINFLPGARIREIEPAGIRGNRLHVPFSRAFLKDHRIRKRGCEQEFRNSCSPLTISKLQKLVSLGCIHPDPLISQVLEKDLFFDQVISIEENGYEPVYDIRNVENTNSFIANGFIVHNCGLEKPERCRCQMLVRFPWGKTYTLLPLQDMAFYNDRDVLKLLEEREIEKNPNFLAEKIGGVVNACVDFFKKKIDRIQALVWDFQRMDKFDKAFMAFAGEPLITDIQQAWVQATKEAALYKSLDWRKKFLIETLTSAEHDDFHELVNRNFDRLMHTGQIQEAMERTGFWEKFVQEMAVSILFGKVSGAFFDALKLGILKIGKTIGGWRNPKLVSSVLDDVIKKAEDFRNVKHAQYIEDLTKGSKSFIEAVKRIGTTHPLQWYNMLMNEVDLFTSFWKDTVLIYRPAAAVRNAMDNTLKAINEMLNAIVRGRAFWAFQREADLRFIRVDKDIFSPTFGDQARGLKEAGYNWLSNLRDTLYENLLVKPEQWARKGVYVGKLRAFEKRVFDKLTVNPKDLADLIRLEKEMAMKEVNRIFFDYSKRLSKSRVLNNVFPFFDYNVKNIGYWLHDFAHNPWKLKAIIETWDFWSEELGIKIDFKIVGKLPLYVIRGIYFDPFQFTSAKQIISVFSKAVGAKPEWLKASNRHYERLYKMLKGTPELGPRLQANKGFREWLRFRGHRFRYDVINYVDKFLGVSPLVRKGLEALLIAEPEPWRKMFPQSDLIDAISKVMVDSWRREAMAKIRTVDVNKEMRWQKARGEVPDADRARETLVNWSATRDIIGFTWGSYLTRHYQSVHEGWKGVVADSQGSK